MINPKLRNKIIYSITFFKPLFLFVGATCILYSAQPTVEEAAAKWISHSKDRDISDGAAIDFHPSELLDIIARNGHSLPLALKNELIELGFDFNGEIVTRGRPVINDEQIVDTEKFRFHYTLSGTNAVLPEDDDGNGIPDFVDLMVQSFNDIAVIDFDLQNYTVPPKDDWYTNQDDGGSYHYDVYILNLEWGVYGWVQAEDYAQNYSELTRGDNENSTGLEEQNAIISYMGMRNNYYDFPGLTSNIIPVTSAHEFFHAIQYGYDAFEEGWIKEASAVWMEEIHYDDINDCYQYLIDFFNYPDRGPNYSVNRGYGSYIFISYMVDNYFDINFMKSFWENSITHNSYDGSYSILTLKETINQIDASSFDPHFNDSFENITNDFLIANALLTNDAMYDSVYHYDEVSNDNWPITEPVYEEDITLIESDPLFLGDKLLGTLGAHYYKVNVSDSSLQNISIELLPYYPEEGDLYLTIINDASIQTSPMEENEQVVDVTITDEVRFIVSAFTYELLDLLYAVRIVPNSTASTDQLTVESDNAIPNLYSLNGNYPNPFNPSTTISYFIPEMENVVIDIYNINGQRVKIFNSLRESPGKHSIKWNGKDEKGFRMESGIYIYSMIIDGKVFDTKKMLLLK